MSSPRGAMPGSFILDPPTYDQALPLNLDMNVGARSHVFQPPTTPSASSSLYRSTTSLKSDSSISSIGAGRKRSRQDHVSDDHATSGGLDSSSWYEKTAASMVQSASPMSPMPFVNTKYQLAGGLDTPTTMSTASYDMIGGRGFIGRGKDAHSLERTDALSTPLEGDGGYFPPDHAALAREANGRSRGSATESTSTTTPAWSQVVLDVVGGVAGKVWDFCRGGAFQGFYSGADAGYQLDRGHNEDGRETLWQSITESENYDAFTHVSRASTPVPGHFPLDEHVAEDHTPARPAKRVQREKGEGELRGNWILVSSTDTPQSRHSSPLRSRGRASAKGTGARQTSTPTGRAAVSQAGRRLIASSRASRGSQAGSPALHHGRPASFASPRSPASTSKKAKVDSPIPVEAQSFVAKRRREDQEADASIRKFNQQLKAMIREGKEALGSQVEVEDEREMMDMDELEPDVLDGVGLKAWAGRKT